MPNGIPSHDPLGDVMGRLKPGAFAEAFRAWVRAAREAGVPGWQAAARQPGGRRHRAPGQRLRSKARLVLAQQAVADKANEIVAIPDVLSMLELKGAVVTMDAMGCQKSIARQLVEAGAPYVLALKDNYPTLCEEVRPWLVGD